MGQEGITIILLGVMRTYYKMFSTFIYSFINSVFVCSIPGTVGLWGCSGKTERHSLYWQTIHTQDGEPKKANRLQHGLETSDAVSV